MRRAERTYREHRAALVRYIARRIGSAQSAEDLAQEAFLRLMRARPSADIREPAAYLRTIASHLIHAEYVRERREPVTFNSRLFEHAVEQSTERRAADGVAEQIEAQQRIARALAPLRPLHARIVYLRYGEGWSLAQIAARLRLSPHSVKKYLCVALAACRAAAAHERRRR